MATRSFVLSGDVEEGRKLLLEGVAFPNVRAAREKFSGWLEDKLLARLKTYGDFEKLKPVLLGSWSRHELTPKSDIDLLFTGEEADVGAFTGRAFKDGVKLRGRTPKDPKDWSVGVEPFDLLALHQARPLSENPELESQRHHAVKRKREILKAMKREREERRKRQDSISNYLEPNLKYGAGGLRDIEQALALRRLAPEPFKAADDYAFKVLEQIKEELLFIRSWLHLNGSSDVLSAHDQIALAKDLGFESAGVLMKFVQSELERASFYADWVVAYHQAGPKARRAATENLSDPAVALKKLRDDPSLLRQFEARRHVDEWGRALSAAERGKLLHTAVHGDEPDAFLVALYRTRWLEILIPDFKKLKGLVQHDHYHRFTADAHLVQALREVQRLKKHPAIFGIVGRLGKELTAADWWTLKLTALFHDLAKGRKGDHSSEGAKLVDQYLGAWGSGEALTADVRWLVENHLLLSTAAFRQNPQAQSTWKRLFQRGVEGRRLTLLALFTAIDIRATNPEAWTPWKAQLLNNLVKSMNSPEAVSLHRHLAFIKRKKLKVSEETLLALDPLLMQMVAPKILLEDLEAARKAKEDLPVKIWRAPNKRVWIRFHRREDKPGLFFGFVRKLFGLGLSIQLSSVHTLPDVGVYDWFCVRTEKPTRQIAKWLSFESSADGQTLPKVQFQSVELIAQDEDEWILSFRGKDQRGLLLTAASVLFEEGLSLRWARAHTWGQQVEDVFAVRPFGEVEERLARLQIKLVT